MVNLDEATITRAPPRYSSTTTTGPRDDGVVIVVPNLPDVRLAGSSGFNGRQCSELDSVGISTLRTGAHAQIQRHDLCRKVPFFRIFYHD